MLEATETSLLIIEERKRKDIVIGVPHHTPAGVEELPCPEHKAADENAGFLGRFIAEKLNCCSIIACNYPVDVNKFFRTDYTMQIATWNPKVLIEIHGHGAQNARSDIEISSGSSNDDRFSKKLADRLIHTFSKIEKFKGITVCGEYNKIYFKASTAVTIQKQRWIAYHIELPPQLRKPVNSDSGKPPEAGYEFCNILVQIVQELYEKK